ncbi:MAG: CaiB/BaiF CoA transferase family protein [Burkholderiaceae bacterium]
MQPEQMREPRADDASHGPLDGIRVVEITAAVVGPLAGQILGDMGADVIKVEAPEGDNTRLNGPTRSPRMAAIFLGLNRNKRSVVLDIATAEGREALMRLLASADVFITSMRRPAARRLGIDYASVAARNPRIVYAFSPGYRSDGPYADRPAYDDIIQGHAAVAGAAERASGEARYMPTDLSGKLCGYIMASSIAMALYARAASGVGQEVEVPMMENTVAFMLWEHLWGHNFVPPVTPIGYPRLFSPHRRPLKTKDGYLCVLVLTDAQWRRLFEVLELPALADDPRFATFDQRTLHIDALNALVAERIATRSTADWMLRLEEADLPYAPSNRLEDLPADSYLAETGFFEKFEHPSEGALMRTPVTVYFSDTPASVRLPQPRLGQHTEEVLGSLGYDAAQARALGGTR